MTSAILTVLKAEDGTQNDYPGGERAIASLVCNTDTKKKFYDVFINSDFDEFTSPGVGRIPVTKIVNPCNEAFSYVIEKAEDLRSLQECCTNSKNYLITLACSPSGTISVIDVLGNVVGSATTATQYATLWNSNTNNQKIGKLFVQSGWNFILNHLTGNYKPASLPCTSTIPCPTITFGDTGATTIEITWSGTAGQNYFWELANSSNTVLQSGVNNTSLHKVFSGLTASTAYKLRVSNGTAADSTCTFVSHSTSAPPNLFRWDYFTTEPTDLAAATLTHSQAHTAETGISLVITGMGANKWVLAKYAATESDFETWYNTALNNGVIPDSAFESIVTISGNKYIKSRTALTFDESSFLIFSR